MSMQDEQARRRGALEARLILAGLILLAFLMFVPMADCPACVDGIGTPSEWEVVPCRGCGSVKGRVPLLARWRHLMLHR